MQMGSAPFLGVQGLSPRREAVGVADAMIKAQYAFADCILDTQSYALRRAGTQYPLRPKVFQVLRYFVQHHDQVISKQELAEQLWPGQYICDAVVENTIMAVRRAVGDSGRTQGIIQTLPGYGYRFIAAVTVADEALTPGRTAAEPQRPARAGVGHLPSLVVGREAEFTQLYQWYTTALARKRQVGFIRGEAGIGKTTLVEAFVARVTAEEAVWVGHGQCIEQYGAGEAYLPVLEALGRLCRGTDGAHFLTLLRQHAPSWLLQMPTLLPAAEREELQRMARSVTQPRMLRELAEAMEILTAERPLLLVLEDLHWSDRSTLDWLAYVARRRDPARLLVLATYRAEEALGCTHPVHMVTQELLVHGQGTELVLGALSSVEVATYLLQRFEGAAWPAALAQGLHQRTDGHPLFLVAVVDELIQKGVLGQGTTGRARPEGLETIVVEVPESLHQLIGQQLERLEPGYQQLLETASVAGMEFSAAAIAAAMDGDAEAVEAQCATLARHARFVQTCRMAAWPDGTVTTQYRFRHALYQEVLYKRVPAGRQVRIHRQIGERLEAGYGAQAGEIAAELAVHFARGRAAQRAVQYQHTAGENALRRSAHQEAIAHLTQGLALLATLPAGRERVQQELALQLALGNALIPTRGYTPAVEIIYSRAQELCQQLGETPQVFPVLRGLVATDAQRGKLQTALAHGETFFHLAQRQHEPALLLEAHRILASLWLHLGGFACAHKHVLRGQALYDVEQHHAHVFLYAQDPGVSCLIYAALLQWFLGYPDQAIQRGDEALTLAQGLAHPHSLAFAQSFLATVQQLCWAARPAQAWAEASIALCREQGFAFRLARGTILRGWALAAQGHSEEGIAQMQEGLAAHRATGIALGLTYYLALLAEGYGYAGQMDKGLMVVREALATVHTTGERWWKAELYRLQGELLLSGSRDTHEEAERCFHRALAIARHQHAQSWELRAATSLSRLWQQQGKGAEARQLLAEVYGWFTEGFDTADLLEAQMLLTKGDGILQTSDPRWRSRCSPAQALTPELWPGTAGCVPVRCG
jgi:predicted ATPase/DNA-binding winged helix-turn-helix (wHTH) protein